jgi:hypothetical protein
MQVGSKGKYENRGDDALRCHAEVTASGKIYRCCRDRSHSGKHFCNDDGICLSFDDWAAGLEDDEVPHAD